MNKKIDLEDIARGEFADERAAAFSHDVADTQKEYLTDEISDVIIDLKRIISKNAAIYHEIEDIKPILFDDVFSLLLDMNKEDEEDNLTLDYSNFHKKLLSMPIVSDNTLEYVHSDGKTVNLYEGGKIECVRNIIIEVLYGKRDNGNNSYRIKTYSSFYAYYLLKNNDLVLADNLSFDKHNKLASVSNEMYGIITESAKYSSDIARQKILFSYLAERGTGLNFKFLLYKYAQLFFKELSEPGFEKDAMDFSVKDYIYYFTMFRTVCMFPDDEFFVKVHKIVSFLLKRRMEPIKNGTGFHICEEQTGKISNVDVSS